MPDQRTRKQLHRPRVADLVANDLRTRILSGEVADGEFLPTQDQLLEEFGVSMASIREALRILETEGLVTVVRGSAGGGVVRLPTEDRVAYMMALVLQTQRTTLDDVASVMRSLEPVCAASAAQRPDRADTIVPALRANIRASEEAIDDTPAFVRLARAFHEEFVAGCGNNTLTLLVGAVERLWSVHVETLGTDQDDIGSFDDMEFRLASLASHAAIVDAIEGGDAMRAAELVALHMSAPEMHSFIGQGRRIEAWHLRD